MCVCVGGGTSLPLNMVEIHVMALVTKLKGLAKESLQLIYSDQIITQQQLCMWTKKNIESINFAHSNTEVRNKTERENTYFVQEFYPVTPKHHTIKFP